MHSEVGAEEGREGTESEREKQRERTYKPVCQSVVFIMIEVWTQYWLGKSEKFP